MEMEQVDLIIIGCGWNGIAMAKTYHEAEPQASIRLVDSAESVGGCWAADRVYPGLNTNNILGSYEFSDFPMKSELVGCHPGSHIPGSGVHRYLCEAVRYFDLERYLMLQTKIETAKMREDDVWEIKYISTSTSKTGTMIAKKLVVATGLTSEPSMPVFKGREDFQGLCLHSKQLKPRAEDLAKCENVVVIGGNKSAWDVCYSVAKRGGKAHMVMRPSGGGPSWVWPRTFNWFGFQTSLPKLTTTRVFCLFDPWPFVDHGSIWSSLRNFLHRTSVGKAITNGFWSLLGKHICQLNGYGSGEEMGKLTPWASTYWMGNSLSTLNYPSDWFEFVRSGNIVVRHAEVDHLTKGEVHLTDGIVKDVDGLVCCTGWKALPPIDFQPPEVRDQLGLPRHVDNLEAINIEKAHNWILDQRPALGVPARKVKGQDLQEKITSTPYQLYRFVIPSSKRTLTARNIAYIGTDFSLHTIILAQAQALWITAFFQHRLRHFPDSDRIAKDTVLHSEYQRLRRPKIAGGSGEKFGDLVFDSLPYVDMLLRDLGLETQRKGNVLSDLFVPYSLRDFVGLVQEWKRTLA